MADALTHSLQRHFGHTSFRPLQREIIESVLSGAPTLAILPTGGGKSLTFQLPALLLDGVTIVISPLLSLIQDQTQELERIGLPVGRYDSTLSSAEKTVQLKRLKSGETKLFYTSPESLANPELYQTFKSLPIGLVAIDEAHCISDWGHSFRPSYLYLPKLIRSLKPHSLLALTATATRKTSSEIRKLFKIKTAHQFSDSNLRPNLEFSIRPCLADAKDPLMIETLSSKKRLPAIVYAMRQEQCESIAHTLNQAGFIARSYHAGLNNSARTQVQNAFLSDEVEVVVATIAFGMGVDKPNIRTVLHYHLPKSPEGWMQEAGRAGRDGQASLCQLLACGDDLIPLENFIRAKEVRKAPLHQCIESLFAQGKSAQLSPYHTRVQFDFHVSTFDIMLARLELARALNFTNSSWRYAWAWPVTGRLLDLKQFPKKLRPALEHILHLGERYDTQQSETEFSVKPAKLWEALEALKRSGDIVLKPSGWLWNFKLLKTHSDADQLASELLVNFSHQYSNDIEKLKQVEKIATSRACIPNNIAKWFGEKPSTPCGICSSCRKEKRPTKLPRSPLSDPSSEQLERIQQLVNNPKSRIQTNQQLTRLLCGIPTPYLRHFWLNRRAEFGMLSKHHYTTVYAYAKAALNAQD